jgi:hypothetical protein
MKKFGLLWDLITLIWRIELVKIEIDLLHEQYLSYTINKHKKTAIKNTSNLTLFTNQMLWQYTISA